MKNIQNNKNKYNKVHWNSAIINDIDLHRWSVGAGPGGPKPTGRQGWRVQEGHISAQRLGTEGPGGPYFVLVSPVNRSAEQKRDDATDANNGKHI